MAHAKQNKASQASQHTCCRTRSFGFKRSSFRLLACDEELLARLASGPECVASLACEPKCVTSLACGSEVVGLLACRSDVGGLLSCGSECVGVVPWRLVPCASASALRGEEIVANNNPPLELASTPGSVVCAVVFVSVWSRCIST